MTVAASAHRAAIHQPRRAGVAWQLGEAGVIAPGLQFRAHRGVFLHRCGFALVALYPCFLGHKKLSVVVEGWSDGLRLETNAPTLHCSNAPVLHLRSEERRVGKE